MVLDVGVEVTIGGGGLLLILLQSRVPLVVGKIDLTAVVLLEDVGGTHLEYSCSECGGFV